MPTSLDLFNEDVYASMDSNGHIVRKDMFKGSKYLPFVASYFMLYVINNVPDEVVF